MKRSVLLATACLSAAASLSAALPVLEAIKPEPVVPASPPAPAVPDVLDLNNALLFALDNNFSIRQARERLRQQEGLIVEVRAQALPDVSLEAGYSRKDKAFSSTDYQDWRVGVYVRQLVYSGGGVRAALDAAQTTRQAAVLDIEAVVSNVLLAVRTRFADVLLNRQRITVQEQSVALLNEQLQTVKNRFEAGSVSQFEVLTAEVALANAQPALITARNAYRVAIDELRAVLGYQNPFGDNLAKVPNFKGELTFTPAAYELESALAAAKARRPELQRLAQLERARESGLTVAKADYLPTVSVTAGYEDVKSRSSNSFSDSVDGWTTGVSASWAIFDGARTKGRVAQARSQLSQARLSVAEQTLAIEVEVRRALSSLQEAAELAGAATKVVGQAEEALRLADVRYRNGAATQLDVLQARQALTEASLNRLEANYRHTIALATLRKAIAEGDLVETAP